MPVTAKLSRKFYDQFGEELANELVDWFNKVDETYRAQLRELNDVNFARFDAKMGERLAELRADLRSDLSQLRSETLAAIGSEKSEHQIQLAVVRTELTDKMNELRTELSDKISDQKADLMRWMFGLWATQILAIIGLAIALRP